MLKAGKKTKQWNTTRAKLKVRFERADIMSCEFTAQGLQCGSTFALGFAHSRKRNDITTQEQLEECVLLCQTHHRALEDGNKHEMFRVITAIIAARETPV